MADTEQARALKKAKEVLDLTTEGLADELGVSIHTLQSWLLPEKSDRHRPMPKTAKLLLARIVAEARKKKG